ncbi:MAG: hypothetical protein JO337_11800 [Acidimicrobiales bacterium]|nr:hypothetical protein [Acidimicrobiales bacterium]
MSTSLDEAARRAGAHHWIECRLFEVLGSWVPSTAEAGTKLMLDRHSRHHAWRAEQWRDRLPVLADLERDQLSMAPAASVAAALENLQALEDTPSRLAGAYRVVLPRLWSSYRRHRHDADPVSDSSTLRTLRIVTRDVAADWHEGESRLQDLLLDGAAVEGAAAAVLSVERLLVDPQAWM